MPNSRTFLSLALCVLAVAPAHATDAISRAIVVDGGTIELHGKRIRLRGIAAPAIDQTCETAAGAEYPCGEEAARALSDRIGDQPVHCVEQVPDRDGSIVALCRAGGEDLAEWMAVSSWAVTANAQHYDYERAQSRAKQTRQGLWQGRFVEPRLWAEGERLD